MIASRCSAVAKSAVASRGQTRPGTGSGRVSASPPLPTRRGALLSGLGMAGTLIGLLGSPVSAESVFVGQYNDPSHPGCRREIDAGGRVYGADPVPIRPGAPCKPGEPTDPWTLQAKISDDDKFIVSVRRHSPHRSDDRRSRCFPEFVMGGGYQSPENGVSLHPRNFT